MGGALPKQFQDLMGRPVLWWSMKAFIDEDPSVRIILVLNEKFIQDWNDIYFSLPVEDRFAHDVVPGGNSRTASVKKGLFAVPDSDDCLVAIHDAARPLVTPEMIAGGWKAAAKHGGAVPVVPVTDSLRLVGSKDHNISSAVDRSLYMAVQTPQVFRADLLKEAYKSNPDAVFSDDASAFEAAGGKTALFDGSPSNMKVTNPGDIEIASVLLSRFAK